jgi:hypothetical protein
MFFIFQLLRAASSCNGRGCSPIEELIFFSESCWLLPQAEAGFSS